MLFDVFTPERILFGPGSTYRLGEEVRVLGRKALVITGRESLKKSGNVERITQPLTLAEVEAVFFDEITPEPSVLAVDAGRRRVRETGCTVVVGVGGGSVLDVAKAVAGLAGMEGDTGEYLRGREITGAGLPFVAVPTTAGSGSEVTVNAVLVDPEAGKKTSLRHDRLLARVAVVDPILTMSMPSELTAQTGLDALTHAVEAYTSRWSTAYSRALSREAVRLIAQNFYTAYSAPGRREARENMLLASLMAGMALNTARAGVVHALAHPLGARYGLSHGLVCGVLLPYAMEFNLPVVEDRYAELAGAAGLTPPGVPENEAAIRFTAYVKRLVDRLGLPERLGPQGLTEGHVPDLVETAMGSSSLAANPRKATGHDLTDLVNRLL
ncbi:MAG: iron-containing alcohol dehydrogenase [Candidatus Desulforudis sp.]|nr:iron-containing alcohol dehydrogenase [Desulforudis sp.]